MEFLGMFAKSFLTSLIVTPSHAWFYLVLQFICFGHSNRYFSMQMNSKSYSSLTSVPIYYYNTVLIVVVVSSEPREIGSGTCVVSFIFSVFDHFASVPLWLDSLLYALKTPLNDFKQISKSLNKLYPKQQFERGNGMKDVFQLIF